MIARQESRQALLDVGLMRAEVIYQVSSSFLRLLLAQEKLAYDEQNLELAGDFARLAEVKCSAGDIAQVEVLRARVEASRAVNEVRTAANELAQARAGLNYWLGRRESEPVIALGTMKWPAAELDVERLKSRALALRPERRKIDEALRAERLKQNLSFLGYMPDLRVGVARHGIVGEASTWDVTLSLDIPIFFWQPLTGEIAEARAREESLKQEARDVENAIVREVEEAFRGAQSAREQIELFEKDILSQSEKSYDMLLLSFREGEIGGLELIEARRTLLAARKAYADTLFLHAQALAALEKHVGERPNGGSHEETKR
jgi:outer membrane protein TolC